MWGPCFAVRDTRRHGNLETQALGYAALPADAVRRVMRVPPAVIVPLVDAENEAAAGFYEHHGFQRLVSAPMNLFPAMSTAERTLLGRR